ncbi:MAG: hypothetical protein VX095_00350 [Pseudomonadota bacterium]|nr:hypothetical protein [Pseudomonadota bacterium]
MSEVVQKVPIDPVRKITKLGRVEPPAMLNVDQRGGEYKVSERQV